MIIKILIMVPKGVPLKRAESCLGCSYSGYPYDIRGYDPYFELSTDQAKVHLSTILKYLT